jgi:hypothetical protein
MDGTEIVISQIGYTANSLTGNTMHAKDLRYEYMETRRIATLVPPELH